jgi:hypothetical protein
MSGIYNPSKGEYYCPACCRYFISNASTAAIENSITIHLPDGANAAKDFYYTTKKHSEIKLLADKLTINAKAIIINNDRISITIDKDNIDKFDVIEINGVSFVREADHV